MSGAATENSFKEIPTFIFKMYYVRTLYILIQINWMYI